MTISKRVVPSRFKEILAARSAYDGPVFASARRRMTSVAVRGDQMAEQMGGVCLRARYLNAKLASTAPALLWIVEPNLEQIAQFDGLTPQFLDFINPGQGDDHVRWLQYCHAVRYLILNTESCMDYIEGQRPGGWRSWVIPHHHCNAAGWVLPDARLERPAVVGYVGEPENLHDHDAIANAVESLGMRLVCADTRDLLGYREIDIGIAWTRPRQVRDETRSNIKVTNFVAHGIPSVVCNYESYRKVNEALGGCATVIRSTLDEFLEGLALVAQEEELRRKMAAAAPEAIERYSRSAIAELYWSAIGEARAEMGLDQCTSIRREAIVSTA